MPNMRPGIRPAGYAPNRIRDGMRMSMASGSLFTPKSLFSNNEQGVWYDPSDFSSMFHDSAGTTPVTAIEQPVGLILDKSGRGNHASQSTTTSRPILRSLYNLMTYTEQFDNAAWFKDFAGPTVLNVSTNSTTAPDGTTTADTITEVANTNFHRTGQVLGTLAPVSLTFSVYVKNASGNRYVGIAPIGSSGAGHNAQAVFDLQNKTYLGAQTAAVSLIGTIVNPTITDAGNGWLRLSATGTSTLTGTIAPSIFLFNTFVSNGVAQGSYAGDGTSGIYVWGASVVPANENFLPYQRVVTNTPGSGVYDTDLTKFMPYLFFDGTDDWLQTGNINFSATDKLSVFVGVRKLSDEALRFLAELSASSTSNTGTFALVAPTGAVGDYAFRSRGSTSPAIAPTAESYPAPITNILTGLGDISSDLMVLRVNGSQSSTQTADQGTGTFGNYPLYIGRRGGTTSGFVGRLYSLIIRGALTSSPHLDEAERWVASKTGVTL